MLQRIQHKVSEVPVMVSVPFGPCFAVEQDRGRRRQIGDLSPIRRTQLEPPANIFSAEGLVSRRIHVREWRARQLNDPGGTVPGYHHRIVTMVVLYILI